MFVLLMLKLTFCPLTSFMVLRPPGRDLKRLTTKTRNSFSAQLSPPLDFRYVTFLLFSACKLRKFLVCSEYAYVGLVLWSKAFCKLCVLAFGYFIYAFFGRFKIWECLFYRGDSAKISIEVLSRFCFCSGKKGYF